MGEMKGCCNNPNGELRESTMQGFFTALCTNCGFSFPISRKTIVAQIMSALEAEGYTNVKPLSLPWDNEKKES